MITIKKSAETSFVVKKSKFLGLACHAENEQQVQMILEQRRKQYFDASHNCYSYALENGVMRYSDDGEPQGTAGLPMLDVIRKSGLSNVLVISTRYFGGTLLGAGGLIRAYTKSASDTLSAAQKTLLLPCSVYECAFSYGVWAKAEKTLQDTGYILENIRYLGNVNVTVCVQSGNEERFLEHISSISLGKTIPVLFGRKTAEAPFPGKK